MFNFKHTPAPSPHPFDPVGRLVCLESNRSSRRSRCHGNVAPVSDAAAAADWRKWQTFDTSFLFFAFLVLPRRRARPECSSTSPVAARPFFPCLDMFERVSFSPLPFSRVITVEEIGVFKLFFPFFYVVGKW